MPSSHRMGMRSVLIAAFLVAAPLVAVFQGPLQDRLALLWRRSSADPQPFVSGQPQARETAGFRPAVRGDQRVGEGSVLESRTRRRPMFPDEPDEGSPRETADHPNRKEFEAVQTDYQEDARTPQTADRKRGNERADRRWADEAAASVSTSDPLTRPYARLRDLGATSSRLETWGADGDRYRFQCRVATDADRDSTETRHFEATDAEPLRAIEKVVRQVEDWQIQRR